MNKVAIIGAGPSGITAIKNFSDLGFEVTAVSYTHLTLPTKA